MGISRIDYGGVTLMDLTADTVTAEVLAEGYTATTASGERIVGTLHVPTKAELLDWFYPVGSIYQSVSSADPSTTMGGTWVRIKDRFLLAAGDTYIGGTTGGSATKTITGTNMPSHTHNNFVALESGTSQTLSDARILYRNANGKSGSVGILNTGARGDGEPLDIMPPYQAVYTWRRTA